MQGKFRVPLLERPDVTIENVDGKELARTLKEMAKNLNIDLSKADKKKTVEILRKSSPLADEVVKMRNSG